MASKRKNSLVENINRRKRAGKSRPKSRSTISKESYEQMEQGWPKSAGSRKRPPARKSGGVKKKAASTKRASARKASGKKKKAAKKK